jgi:UDP-glucose 4-epimerase
MSILVTGHKGYIGSRLYKSLVDMGYAVTGVDLKDGHDIIHCLPNGRFDYVFHMAAFPKVQYSVENPSYTMRHNAYATSILLDWARTSGVKRVVFSSSAAVLGDGNGPTSPYGLHKLVSEKECELYHRLYKIDTVSLRYFNVYSEDQQYGGSYSTVISAWMEMLRQGRPLRIDGDGEQTRDFIHVDDIVLANVFCMKHLGVFSGKCLNVATGVSISMNYIKNYIDNHRDVEWSYGEERAGDIKHSAADIEELTKMGWNPTVSIEQGLARCFR